MKLTYFHKDTMCFLQKELSNKHFIIFDDLPKYLQHFSNRIFPEIEKGYVIIHFLYPTLVLSKQYFMSEFFILRKFKINKNLTIFLNKLKGLFL